MRIVFFPFYFDKIKVNARFQIEFLFSEFSLISLTTSISLGKINKDIVQSPTRPKAGDF